MPDVTIYHNPHCHASTNAIAIADELGVDYDVVLYMKQRPDRATLERLMHEFVIPLYADLRFAGESAVFTTAFAQRGLIAEHGVSWLLPRLVGLPAAMDLLCSARKFRAPEALAMRLVSRVISDDKLMAETRAYATLLANTVSPRSVAVMKRQIWEAEFQTLAEATTQANYEMDLSFQTADFKEGVAHFLEKRAARFTGK